MITAQNKLNYFSKILSEFENKISSLFQPIHDTDIHLHQPHISADPRHLHIGTVQRKIIGRRTKI